MAIWQREATLEQLNLRSQNTMVDHIGIRFTVLAEDRIEAVMPVDQRTRQPFGLLHGGASVVLAETLGSMAGYLCTEGEQQVVGLEINANHLRAAREGEVRGVCRSVHLGRRHQVWQIEIFDNNNRLCCTSRLTTAVI
ncbi:MULTISPECIES: hotdog fold thioesterase [Erwinia]|uniref:1,4-dihydroxy-2-naphthoyl-CoA hydrolase n=1 Tax=Erwinia rhapontici TaxID=55212 RepID=A0ABN6DMG7_ERWRD|nr:MULTISPECIES: hotdog fold thioesterase [Erwinia]MBP2155540.1 1,4-dihydroxy-2-naphthoyl-CoA hydrolase [Erwinia rhapontici]MCS3605892.1 1,4-dihydroxy-2-naphthoyl-CoA hydrolase [Erwinia rhapontici]NKG32286.1 hotdog fold thioesterase [Erwinia rhapontici]NNS05979.1 hotdog fold thioesterase [Erwinia sp. JH02]TDS98505.1 1,4-dihydroxy-2-naphthoyl-CoA hydrolase [Erwinia rhapontici]